MAVSARGVFQRNFLIAFLIAALIFLLHFLQIVNFRELDAVDFRQWLRGQQKTDSRLLLVEIDQSSLDQLGSWPWPRNLHSEMIDLLRRSGAALVFYDVFFKEPAENQDDRRLAEAVEKAANVILPFIYIEDQPLEAIYPQKALKESARTIGFVNTLADNDGRIRRIQSYLKLDGTDYFHTAVLSVLAEIRDEETARKRLRSLPVNHRGEIWINDPGGESVFRRKSFSEILELSRGGQDSELRKIFEGKIVLVGQSHPAAPQARQMLYSRESSGFWIQAAAMNTLLSRSYLVETGPFTVFFLLLIVSLWTALLAAASPPKRAWVGMIATMAVYGVFNILVFYLMGIFLPLFMPLTAMAATFTALIFYKNSDMSLRDELMKRELAMAAKIQATFLPDLPPACPGIQMAFKCKFAEHIGGDFYDWADLGGDRIALAVGDVSGKGIPAAIYMVCAISELRREVKSGRSPARTLQALNLQLATQTYSGMFLTMTAVVIDQAQRKLNIASAGHEPLFYFHAAERRVELVDALKGPPLGLFTDAAYEDLTRSYEEGDILMLISDGVKESRNPRGRPLGLEAVKNFLKEQGFFLNPQELVDGIFALMEEHLQGSEAHDDRTVFCIKLGHRF